MNDTWEGWRLREFIFALAPAILIFAATMIVSLTPWAGGALFLGRGIERIPIRFFTVAIMLVAPLPLLPRLLSFAVNVLRNLNFIGCPVKIGNINEPGFDTLTLWLLRPLQGVALSMIFAKRLLNLFESSLGTQLGTISIRQILPLLSSALIGLLLSTIWALDDLGARIHNERTGEVRMAGSRIGVILPILSGIFGVYNLFQLSDALTAMITILQIVAVLYPPYALFAVAYQAYLRRHSKELSKILNFRIVETKTL